MKKTVSVLLSILMILTMLPSIAFGYELGADLSAQVDSAIIGAVKWYGNYEEDFGAWDAITLTRAISAYEGMARTREWDEEWESALAEMKEKLGAYLDGWTELCKGYAEEEKVASLALNSLALFVTGTNPDSLIISGAGSAVDYIAAAQLEDGSFGYITDTLYAVLLLESVGYSRYSRAAAAKNLLGQQLKDGGYTYYGEEGDVDATAMALPALYKLSDIEGVSAAIEGASKFLASKLTENGGYVSVWSETGSENSNSVAVALSGLAATGGFAKDEFGGVKMLQNLLSFVCEDGGFIYETVDSESNYFATYQGLMALCDVRDGAWTNDISWEKAPFDPVTGYLDGSEITDGSVKDVSAARSLGIMCGGGRSFRPGDLLTRAELATIVGNIAGVSPAENGYADISGEEWYAAAMLSAAASGAIGAETNEDGEKLLNPQAAVGIDEILAAAAFVLGADSDEAAGELTESFVSAGILGEDYAGTEVTRELAARLFVAAVK